MKKSWTWYLAHFSKINIGGNRCWLILVFVSATLSGVETLKYPSSYGICFFDKIFSFFNLASDFFSRWNFSKNGFSVLILRYWFIYIFDIRNHKNYFFNANICFDNNFYFKETSKFIYLFLLQNLNNFVSFKTLVVERWLIQMNRPVAAPTILVLLLVLFMIESTTAHVEVARKVASYRGMSLFPQQCIYLWAYICKTSQWL